MEIRVGTVLYPGRTLPAGVLVDNAQSWCVMLAVTDATQRERDALTIGAVDAAVSHLDGALVFMVRTDALGWSAGAWVPSARTAPEAPPAHPVVKGILSVLLLDAKSTKVLAMRTLGLTDNLARALRALEAEARRAEAPHSLADAVKWTNTHDADEISAAAKGAPVVTGVPAKRS